MLRCRDDGITVGAIAVARGHGIGSAEHFLGEVSVVPEAFLVGAVLTEDFDVAHVAGGDDDIAARVSGSSDVRWRLFRFAGFIHIGCANGWCRRKGTFCVAVLGGCPRRMRF